MRGRGENGWTEPKRTLLPPKSIVAAETLLQKTKDNVAQSSLSSREERQKNVVGAYVAVNEDKIKGQRILLIDDILTTGATLREAARVLREAGAEKVICATLAAADED